MTFENRFNDEIKKLFESSEIVFGIFRVKQSHIYISYKKMEPCFISLKKKIFENRSSDEIIRSNRKKLYSKYL